MNRLKFQVYSLQSKLQQMSKISLAETDAQIAACFPTLHELRPHLVEAEFVQRVRRQQQSGYQLAYLQLDENVVSVAGFRVSECLASGRFLYVDDLVTQASVRSLGYGDQLFDWLVAYAKSQDCEQLQLDSGVQRFAAHRFYLRKRMEITSHHFALKL
jgi:GNAT superfamily N-acetyltransferase